MSLRPPMRALPSAKPSAELNAALSALAPLLGPVLLLSILSSVLSLAPTFYMLEVYDRVVNSRSMTTLTMLTIAVAAALMMMAAIEWVRAALLRQAGQRFDDRLAERVFRAVFSLTLIRGPGLNLQQAFADLRTLREALTSPAVLAILEIPGVLLLLLILFLIHAAFGWAALIGALLQTALALLTERRTQPPLTRANLAAHSANNYAANAFANAQVIEAMGMLAGIEERWLEKQRQFLLEQARASDRAGALSASAKSVQLIQGSLLLGLGAWLMLAGEFHASDGLLIVGSILGGRALQPLVMFVSNWKTVVAARNAYARLRDLLTEVPAPTEKMSLPPPSGRLSVEAVTVAPPEGGPVILHNVSFALEAGQCLAIVGPSASGKSTLARLLVGVWPAMAGKVRLDGADVFAWDKAELGPYIGYLPQDVELFDGTLAENITRFAEPDQRKLEAAARLAGLDDVLASLPNGFASRIGEDGAILSGGQRQRVGLARAIYGEPKLVVLDEPNSSLDEAGEKTLFALIQTLKSQGTTVVLITHRPNILAVADWMLVLVAGTNQAFGRRDEVLAALAKANEAQRARLAASKQG